MFVIVYEHAICNVRHRAVDKGQFLKVVVSGDALDKGADHF